MKGINRLTEIYKAGTSKVTEVKHFTEEMLAYIGKKTDSAKPTALTDEERKSIRELAEALQTAAEEVDNGKRSSLVSIQMTTRSGDFAMGIAKSLQQRSLIVQMVLAHLISLSETFVRDYVSELLTAHPKMLRSGAQITFEELSSYKSIKKLHRGLAEREVGTFAHQGVDELAAFFLKRMNIDLATFPEWDALRENSYRRNTVSHNGARIDATYQKKLKSLKIKDAPVLDEKYVDQAASRILNFQKFLHETVKSKFG